MVQFTQHAYASGVNISWMNSGGDTTGYKVYYGTASQNYDTSIDVGPFNKATIDGLIKGATYFFAVTAYNSSGSESGYSEEIKATIPEQTGGSTSSAAGVTSGGGGSGGGCTIYADNHNSAFDPLFLLLITIPLVRILKRFRYTRGVPPQM